MNDDEYAKLCRDEAKLRAKMSEHDSWLAHQYGARATDCIWLIAGGLAVGAGLAIAAPWVGAAIGGLAAGHGLGRRVVLREEARRHSQSSETHESLAKEWLERERNRPHRQTCVVAWYGERSLQHGAGPHVCGDLERGHDGAHHCRCGVTK